MQNVFSAVSCMLFIYAKKKCLLDRSRLLTVCSASNPQTLTDDTIVLMLPMPSWTGVTLCTAIFTSQMSSRASVADWAVIFPFLMRAAVANCTVDQCLLVFSGTFVADGAMDPSPIVLTVIAHSAQKSAAVLARITHRAEFPTRLPMSARRDNSCHLKQEGRADRVYTPSLSFEPLCIPRVKHLVDIDRLNSFRLCYSTSQSDQLERKPHFVPGTPEPVYMDNSLRAGMPELVVRRIV